MKIKNLVTVVLLLFVGVSVVYLVVQEAGSPPTGESAGTGPDTASATEQPTATDGPTPPRHKLIAYYFHRTQRCKTCLAIEAYAKEALQEAFPDGLASGELEGRIVNVEEPANEHFVRDYELTSSAVVLVDMKHGAQEQWRNLEKVWDLVGNELKFKAYVEGEALAYLEGGL